MRDQHLDLHPEIRNVSNGYTFYTDSYIFVDYIGVLKISLADEALKYQFGSFPSHSSYDVILEISETLETWPPLIALRPFGS